MRQNKNLSITWNIYRMCDRDVFLEPIIDGLDLSIQSPLSLKNISCVIYPFEKNSYSRGYFIYPKRSKISNSYRFGIYLECNRSILSNYDVIKSCLVGSISGTIDLLTNKLGCKHLRYHLSPINHFNTPDIKVEVPVHSDSLDEFMFEFKKDQFEYMLHSLRNSFLCPNVIDVILFDSWINHYIKNLSSIDLDDYYRPYDKFKEKRRLRDLWKYGIGKSIPIKILHY